MIFLKILLFCVCVSVGLLRMLFSVLLNEDIVKEEIFFEWQSSAEVEAVRLLGSFFKNLQTATQMIGLLKN